MSKDAVTIRKNTRGEREVRISSKVRRAIEAIVYEGLNRRQAAERVGLREHSLYVAMRRPHILAFRQQCLADLRGSAASRSVARAEKLADTSDSDHVRLEANKWLAGLEGITPAQRSEHLVHGRIDHHVSPGYVLDLTPQAPEDAEAIEDGEGSGP